MEKHKDKRTTAPLLDERIAYGTPENCTNGLVTSTGLHDIRRSILRKLLPQMDEAKRVSAERDMNCLLPKGEIGENEADHLGWVRCQSQVKTKTKKRHGQKEKNSTQKEAQTPLQP